ncbi:MAG: exodeoxyribonuclease VII large subunit [Pseudomonadota bacterium]
MEKSEIWTVTGINRAAREILERNIGTVWIEAEVSNLARPASGHLYFSLKDAGAQLRAAFFRQRQRGSVRDLSNGDQVLVRGKLSLYEPRGDYQLIVEHLEPAGEGALRRAYELLRLKLAAEGLFDEQSKQALPAIPRSVGVITSTSTAALRDILKVLRGRMPWIDVHIYAATVQGDQAASTLRAALGKAIHRHECDVLIIARGGGSLEDLAAFNDEQLARDVAACSIPVISGVGHETDVTIVDFVADQRAPTPSAAAELAGADQQTLLGELQALGRRLLLAEQRPRQTLSQATDHLSRRLALQNPAAQLARKTLALRDTGRRMSRALNRTLESNQQRLRHVTSRLQSQTPAKTVLQRQTQLMNASRRLKRAYQNGLTQQQEQLQAIAKHLHAVSPLAVLGRGYSIVTVANSGDALDSVSAIAAGDAVDVRLADGSFSANVNAVTPLPASDKKTIERG